MEVKERYELKIYAGCESYSITDAKEKHQLTVENAVNLLNKYDKQIAELKAENERLRKQLSIDDDVIEMQSDRLKKQEQQLKDNTKQVRKEVCNENKI